MSATEENVGIAQTTSGESRPTYGLQDRELDALVAEKVFGCTGRMTVYAWADRKKRANPVIVFADYPSRALGDFRTVDTSFSTWADEEGGKISRCYWPCNYSTDIAVAMIVVEKMRTTDGGDYEQYWIFTDCCELGWRAELWSVPNQSDGAVPIGEGAGETLPLAICRAALEAVGRDSVSPEAGAQEPASDAPVNVTNGANA